MRIIVIGAGPAGLAAAYTLVDKGANVTVFEKDSVVGGISRTVTKNGYRFDLGGHRFFSKNPELNLFIENLLGDELIDVGRRSRIYFKKRYFDYPLEPKNAVFGLGLPMAFNILCSYICQKITQPFKRKRIATLEDWVVDKFGYQMFRTYFKSYTEKVWGIGCDRIEAEWVAQRIKGMSLTKAVKSAFFTAKKDSPVTLLRQFTYPKLGIGRMSEVMAKAVCQKNKLIMNSQVVNLVSERNRIVACIAKDADGRENDISVDECISSMPITQLVMALKPLPPSSVIEAAAQLRFRDFIAVAIMLNRERVTEDTWIYIHDPDISFGRVHEPKNWSPFMSPQGKTSLVMEYFCFKSDSVWGMQDAELAELAKYELINKLGFISERDCIDYCVVRVPKAYPMYQCGYRQHLNIILSYLSQFKNLQLVGRNGTFRYNNMDHSLEMGIRAAKRLLGDFQDVMAVNTSDEYLEEMRS